MANLESETRENSEWAVSLPEHERVELSEKVINGSYRLDNLLYGDNREIGSNKDYLEYFNSQNFE